MLSLSTLVFLIVAPVDEFHVRPPPAAVICVAGGSGMAPFKSILNDMIERGAMDSRDIWYFFGARSVKDMYYLDWLRGLEAKYPRFHFIPALSEPRPEDKRTGPVGLITDVLVQYLTDRIPRDQVKEGYLCGSPGIPESLGKHAERRHHCSRFPWKRQATPRGHHRDGRGGHELPRSSMRKLSCW